MSYAGRPMYGKETTR